MTDHRQPAATPVASSSADTTGRLEITTPGRNAEGDEDWLLVGESG